VVSRNEADLVRTVESGTTKNVSPRPAIFFGILLLSLTILAWPRILEEFVSLDWRLGNMRPVAYGLQFVLGVLTVATALGRNWANSKFHKLFPSGKRFIFAAVAFLFSLALTVVAAEGLLRLLHIPFQAKWSLSEDALARFDPELGWSYIPDRSVTQEFGDEHRPVPMYFDTLGCRVRQPGLRADPSAPTILFVGDSFTFGHGVTYEESFVGRLASRPDFPWQVVNLGVQGYGTDQALLLLKRQFKKFNTKVVVYTFMALHVDRNQIYDVRIIRPHALWLSTKPLFALKPDGTLYLAKTPVEYKDFSYSRLRACLEIFDDRWGPKPSVRLTRTLVEEMKEYVESNGAKFLAVDWNQWGPEKKRPLFREGDFPWGLDVDVVRPGVDPPAGWLTWIIPGDSHPDPRAHLYVSELVAKELQRIMSDQGTIASAGAF